ncbi:hypothetical protein [Ligilactobacillus salivarius]|uniref:Baseplate upper protein immunoglobulin like domain-containing protein n=1 Tax=Ligilactobacillus salivarius TaxID=1624 RepID=A0A9X6S707_9LACO|nr:hypothetical protein [Ligilactobacillus salivarius]OTF88298.1 hypothetical protein A8C38_11220 [Ligilactobacillus salivarius]PAY26029.1 hypothetical protein A8C49_11175 [Ligilactobacillus salivarius]PAY27734.1 hypothetical protein A8C44_11220 [Ligilactobacillus salivarius]PAY28473.1 hypothetical protein A8C33_03760 [Ligilactobacillus salivarius]PAY37052.1 hypothetical protein A8C50_03930 [Ligilactobacillus salivarius]
MKYNIYQRDILVGKTDSTNYIIDGLQPCTSYKMAVAPYDDTHESKHTEITIKTRGIRLVIPVSLTVDSTITLNYQEYSLGLVPIGTEPAGMFGGGNKRNIQAKVISVDNGKSTVELLDRLEKDTTTLSGRINKVKKSNFDNSTDLGGWYEASSVNTGEIYRTVTDSSTKPPEMIDKYCLARGGRDTLEKDNTFSISPGEKYYISAWVYTSIVYPGKVGLFLTNSGNNDRTWIGVQIPKDDHYRWIGIEGYITIPDGYNTAQPWLQVDKQVKDNEKLYFTNIQIINSTDLPYFSDNTQMNRLQDGSFAAFNGYKAIYFRQ